MTLATLNVIQDDLALLLGNLTNVTVRASAYSEPESLDILVSMTVVYAVIFVSGLLGNASTCVVIARNRSMHTATNFYLFSLAVSDLLLLICGLPLELHRLWNPVTFPFGEIACIGLGLASETSTNATVLTITAFTVERYIAICHPFMSHTMSKLSRAVRFIIGIWIFAICMAFPQAMQFGIVALPGHDESACTVKGHGVHQVFVISSFVFFVVPMSVISVLYAQIGLKLRHSSVLHPVKKLSVESGRGARSYRSGASQRRVIRMLVAVALSFFVCWAPFHVQRLLAIYGKNLDHPSDTFVLVYVVLNYISGILYFLSTAINPILYNIMSNKFREAFKTTLAAWFGRRRGGVRMARTYSALLASRRERAATLDPGGRARRLCRLSTASTQLDAPPRAQRFNGRDLLTLSESSSCGRWSLAWRLKVSLEAHAGSTSPESLRSISNSSLREFEEELTGEELTTFMYQVNCDIGGLT
ncbi:pyrokinin-1 receptor isoform X1 [Plutella xylostella]|uniref:Pheromone biosynthesis activating neuropeptide isoform-B n=1 Tax=Plutella xylostella TaxID=51655 RepID=A0A1Q3G5K1_PLUXY|nr:pyrokinin-1 receptor isoform X1 [Plutella xylostella]